MGIYQHSNMEIKGTVLTKTEHTLGQYADDTELFLDRSDQSLRAAINILNEFHEMSGLKINFIWNDKRDKITRTMGGLRMVDINSF